MHALPGIVDGARKVSQGGRSILVSARGRNRMFSLLSMLEAILSSDQCMQCMPGMNDVEEKNCAGYSIEAFAYSYFLKEAVGGLSYEYLLRVPLVLFLLSCLFLLSIFFCWWWKMTMRWISFHLTTLLTQNNLPITQYFHEASFNSSFHRLARVNN